MLVNKNISVLGTMNTVLSAVLSTGANASDEVKESLNAIKQQYTQMVSIVYA